MPKEKTVRYKPYTIPIATLRQYLGCHADEEMRSADIKETIKIDTRRNYDGEEYELINYAVSISEARTNLGISGDEEFDSVNLFDDRLVINTRRLITVE